MGIRSLTVDANLCDLRRARRVTNVSAPLRYELNIIAPNVDAAVSSIGGWLFDHTAAGWNVNVLLDGDHDCRPLRILGVGSRELDQWLSGVDRGDQRSVGLAVAWDLRGVDERIEAEVSDALHSNDIQVVQWGPATAPKHGYCVEYRMSAAARVFKDHALAAACSSYTSVGSTETLWRLRRRQRTRA